MYQYTSTQELIDALDNEFESYDSEYQDIEGTEEQEEYDSLDEIFNRCCE